MSDFQQWASSDTAPHVPVNENFEALEGASLYAENKATHSGLTYGLMGGVFKDTTKAATTTALADNNTNYIVAALSDGTISDATTTTNWNDETTYARVAKVTTSGGQITGSVDYRFDEFGLFPMMASAAAAPIKVVQVAVGDETTALSIGTSKVKFRMPYAMTVTAVRGSLSTAQSSGSIFTVDINEAGSTILSTKLTIDNTETTSTTAATPPVVSDASLADDAEISIDIDQIGDGTAKGLKVTLIGT
jgi:hypothetical protein